MKRAAKSGNGDEFLKSAFNIAPAKSEVQQKLGAETSGAFQEIGDDQLSVRIFVNVLISHPLIRKTA